MKPPMAGGNDQHGGEAAVAAAKAALAARDLPGAVAAIEAGLASCPDDPEVLYVGAVVRRMEGRLDAAMALLDQLIAGHPRLGRAHQERGHVLRQQGERSAALEAYGRAVEANPVLSAAWKMLAAGWQGLDDERAAAARAQLAQIEQQDPGLLAALAAWHDGDYALAEARVRPFLLRVPDDPVGMRLLAELGARLGEYEDAELILAKCIEFHPDFLPARFDYVTVLTQRFKHAAALSEARNLLAREPANPQFRTLYANQLMLVGETEAALGQYDALHANEPGHVQISLSRGHALKTLGRVPEAVEAYRNAWRARPDFGDAYWSMANLKTYRFTATEVAQMQAEEARPGIATDDRIHLNFALGKAFDDAGDHAASFTHYQRGNRLRQEVLGYRPGAVTAEVDAQIRHCGPALLAAKAGSGSAAADPIFIVGLPRAGSTLLEQILASHSMVEGTTELPDIMAIAARLNGRQAQDEAERYPAVLAEQSVAELTALGEHYLAATRIHRRADTPFFIDKMPNNFRHIGLIHLILPNARIIDARRDPLDCGFSVFKQLFAQGQDFSYDLAHIGRYYVDYVRLMAHWDAVLPPGRVLRVRHEDVLDDLDGQVRRMLDYCGLPFEPACLAFHQTERAVRTPSSEQVRRPINRDGAGQWKAYDQWLGPLKAELAALS